MGKHTGNGDDRLPQPDRRRLPRHRVVSAIAALALVLAFATIAALRVTERTSDAANQAGSGQLQATPTTSADPASVAAAASSVAASESEAAADKARASAQVAAAVASSAASAASADSAAEVSSIEAIAAQASSNATTDAISIAALNLSTGASYQWGATGGMLTGSIVKLYILETLLLQKQDAGGLSSDEQQTATTMIENSDNDSAEDLFEDIGGRDALIAANATLGLTNTVPGPGDYWGLTQTDAADYITLLHNLTLPTGSPLNATSQAYVLGLMRAVESDQRWGVGVTADPDTDFANKNGWLAVDDDSDLWLVNSTGVVTIKGQTVLIAVLTQHNSDFQAGIDLDQALAQALVPLVVS